MVSIIWGAVATAPFLYSPCMGVLMKSGRCYRLVWNNEFEGKSLSSDWTYEIQNAGWVNNELQRYVIRFSDVPFFSLFLRSSIF